MMIIEFMPYAQSKKFLRNFLRYSQTKQSEVPDLGGVQQHFLNHVLQNSLANDADGTLKAIDNYCAHYPMMNIGDEKSMIVKEAIQKYQPKSILELGGFVGYSSIMMAAASKAHIHSIEPNNLVASIASKLHQHCGLQTRITIHLGTIQSQEQFIKNHGPFDLIFIDHLKGLYLPDLKWLQERGSIRKGTVVVGDNIVYPGSPAYLAYFKESEMYDSVLYHSYLEYTDDPDAVLVSERIN